MNIYFVTVSTRVEGLKEFFVTASDEERVYAAVYVQFPAKEGNTVMDVTMCGEA